MICKNIHYLLSVWRQGSSKETIYIYSFNLQKELYSVISNPHFVFMFFLFICLLLLYSPNIMNEIKVMIVIFISVAIEQNVSRPDKNCILKTSKLHIGYGAALAYFKNYLELHMPYDFNERTDYFESYHHVTLRKKLFILVPFSCRIPRYLDDNNENIERCTELPKKEITHGGVKNRTYNITVYSVMSNSSSKGIRMAIEFAQPLKGLFALKDKGVISEEKMFYERKLFTKTLKTFLTNSEFCKFCEIIEYNDSIKQVSDVLLESYTSDLKVV